MSTSFGPTDTGPAGFGPNEWIVDEIYEQYLKDRSSVDPAWWEFFEGYVPSEASPVAAAHHEAAAVQAAAPDALEQTPAPVAAPPPAPAHTPAPAPTAAAAEVVVLKGPAARVVANMEESLTVPTATSVRAVPAKLMRGPVRGPAGHERPPGRR